MKRRVLGVVASLSFAFVAVTGCTVTNQATDKICQPKQKSRCNDCPKSDPNDTRVYIGWNTCSDDGTEYVGSCSECAPEHPMASSANGEPSASGGEMAAAAGGNAALRPAPDDLSPAIDLGGSISDAGADAITWGPADFSAWADAGTARCFSTTLALEVQDRACAWSSAANDWEQCHDGHWYLGVYRDDIGPWGPAGTCSEVDDVP